MSEPSVVDIRHGLTAEVLDGLQRADRVLLAVKSIDTAALGYWIDNDLSIALVHSAVSRVLLVPHRMDVPVEPPYQGLASRQVPLRGVVLDVTNARDDDFWGRLLGVLRAGDVLQLGHDSEAPRRLALTITSHGARVASLRLPVNRAQGMSAA